MKSFVIASPTWRSSTTSKQDRASARRLRNGQRFGSGGQEGRKRCGAPRLKVRHAPRLGRRSAAPIISSRTPAEYEEIGRAPHAGDARSPTLQRESDKATNPARGNELALLTFFAR